LLPSQLYLLCRSSHSLHSHNGQRPVKDCQADYFRARRCAGSKAFKQKAAVSDSGYRARVLALTSSSTAIHHSCIYMHHWCTARSEAELPFQAFLRFGRSTAPAAAHAQQMAHSPDNENQYCNCDNCQREKVANGIGKNVIRMSRVEAIEAFKRGWQCC
jgi:hypothetical protein